MRSTIQAKLSELTTEALEARLATAEQELATVALTEPDRLERVKLVRGIKWELAQRKREGRN